jgi:hypothetical protein
MLPTSLTPDCVCLVYRAQLSSDLHVQQTSCRTHCLAVLSEENIPRLQDVVSVLQAADDATEHLAEGVGICEGLLSDLLTQSDSGSYSRNTPGFANYYAPVGWRSHSRHATH